MCDGCASCHRVVQLTHRSNIFLGWDSARYLLRDWSNNSNNSSKNIIFIIQSFSVDEYLTYFLLRLYILQTSVLKRGY